MKLTKSDLGGGITNKQVMPRKNKKKGFTLIELLAVIVVLAIILLIATPIILNVIEDAKKGANKSTYSMIEHGAELYIMNEHSGSISDELLIPISSLSEYISKIPEGSENEYVYVKNTGTGLTYYYTGRDSDKSNENKTLKELIENETSILKKDLKVNGRTVNKVIGTKDDKTAMKNYVWYSGYLWQVVETNTDGIKLVMAHSITSIAFGETTNYKTSWVRKWLNDVSSDTTNYPTETSRKNSGIFYNNLSRKDLIVDTEICLDSVTNVVEDTSLVMNAATRSRLVSFTGINTCSNKVLDKVGILTLEDYAYAYDGTLSEYTHNSTAITDVNKRKKGGTMGYNFIDADEYTWLATSSHVANKMWIATYYNPGYITRDGYEVKSYGMGVRPVITLKNTSRVESGTGAQNDPYIISDGYKLENGSKLANVTIGEYIYINEGNNPYETNKDIKEKVRYRVIGKDSNGIKVEREDVLRKLPTTIAASSNVYVPFYTYKDESKPSSTWCWYDSSTSTYYTGGCTNNNYMKNTGEGDFGLYKGNSVGYFLNEASNSFYKWIDSKYQAKIKEVTWDLTINSYGLDATLQKEISKNNNNGSTYPARNYDGEYIAKINLPIWGDILSGNDMNISYWYQNRWLGSSSIVSYVSSTGYGDGYIAPSAWLAVRPVFYLESNIQISSGEGTKTNPYMLNI